MMIKHPTESRVMARQVHVRKWTAALTIALAALCATTTAEAQDIAARSTARQLAEEGLSAYDEGDYATAARKLGQAYDVVKVPTLALHTGRALEKLGRWVEAAELYLEATRLDATGSDDELQNQARLDAADARETLLPKIPRISVGVAGAAPDDVEVTIDGVVVPTALLAAGRLVDPGEHVVLGKLGDQTIEERVTSVESENGTTTLTFRTSNVEPPPAPGAAPVPAPPPGAVVGSPAPGDATIDGGNAQPRPGRGQRRAGWVALGIGGAGLAAGVGSGVALLAMKSSLDSGDCLESLCGPSEYNRVTNYNNLRPVPTIGFAAGGAGIVLGVTLLATAPKREANRHVSPWVGWRSAGITGRF